MIRIEPFKIENSQDWDNYVKGHSGGSLYHLSFFRTVVEKTYNHRSFYFLAIDENSNVRGVLPLFYINSIVFGKELVSLPFCDYGGILADTDEIYLMLFDKALELYNRFRCKSIELRQMQEYCCLKERDSEKVSVRSSKVRMILRLPDTSEKLFSTFPAKLRSQIRKPQKDGCVSVNGGMELIEDFYEVFVHNMRDLGSPVHSKEIISNMLMGHGEKSRIFIVYHNKVPVACSFVGGFNDVLINPWASFKRTYQKMSPNMLLYWEMLNYAVINGYVYFDFGRSTPDEGTYKFKEQWGSQPQKLYWYKYGKNESALEADSGKKENFVKLWRKIPLSITKILGPLVRRHIHL